MSVSIKIDRASNGYVVEIKRKISPMHIMQDFLEAAQAKLLGESKFELPDLPEGIIPSKIEQEEERLIFSTLEELFTCIQSTLNK